MTDFIIDGDDERTCDRCGCLNNVGNGFLHEVADESWTSHETLCRECFTTVASVADGGEGMGR